MDHRHSRHYDYGSEDEADVHRTTHYHNDPYASALLIRRPHHYRVYNIPRSRSLDGEPGESIVVGGPASRSPSPSHHVHYTRHAHSPVRIDVRSRPERGREPTTAGGAAKVEVVNVVNDNQSVFSRSPSPHHHYRHEDIHDRMHSRNDSKASAYAIANGAPWPLTPWQEDSRYAHSHFSDGFSATQQAELERLRSQTEANATTAKLKAEEKDIQDRIESEVNKYKLQLQERKNAEHQAEQRWQLHHDEEERMKKAAEDKAVLKYKQDEHDRKKRDEKAVEEYKQKQEEEKREREKAVKDEMHKRLAKLGLQDSEIDVIADPEKAAGITSLQTMGFGQNRPYPYPNLYDRPTYITVSKDKVEIASLDYFGLPWRYHRVSVSIL